MKKVVVSFVSFFVFAAMASASMLLDRSFLPEPVALGEVVVDTDASYATAAEMLSSLPSGPTSEVTWRSLAAGGVSSITQLYVPVRFAYGFSDLFSFRLTLPYASLTSTSTTGAESKGGGLANIEIEGIGKIMEESSNAPSLSALLKFRNGSGKKISELATGEAYAGSRSTDITLAGVLSKKLGLAVGKLLVGYVLTNAYTENLGSGLFEVDLTDQVVYSLAISYPVSEQLEVAGELWGATSLGKEKWSNAVLSVEFDNSKRGVLAFSPLISYKFSDRFAARGTADIILAKPAAVTINLPDMVKRSTTYTIGATYTL